MHPGKGASPYWQQQGLREQLVAPVQGWRLVFTHRQRSSGVLLSIVVNYQTHSQFINKLTFAPQPLWSAIRTGYWILSAGLVSGLMLRCGSPSGQRWIE